ARQPAVAAVVAVGDFHRDVLHGFTVMLDDPDRFAVKIVRERSEISRDTRAARGGGAAGDEVLAVRAVRAVAVQNQRRAGVVMLNRFGEDAGVVITSHAAVVVARRDRGG